MSARDVFSNRREPWILFAVALLVRIAAIFVTRAPGEVDRGLWEWGYEAGAIAHSVWIGEGFSGQWNRAAPPWDLGSGETAWLSPLYPALIAGLFALFGGLVPGVAIALLCLQGLASAATCVLVGHLGGAIGEARAGRLAAWVFAFLPASIWNAAHVVWDTTFVTLAIVGCAAAFFAFGARASYFRCALLGAGFGLALLVNAAPVALAPMIAWLLWRERDTALRAALRFGVIALVAFVVCVPWLARNARAVGSFALRTNLGIELDVGNNDDANGRYQTAHHPSHGPERFRRYREIGEVAYAREAMTRFRGWVREHPRRFAELTLRRVQIFWVGDDPYSDPRVDERGRRASQDWRSWLKWLPHALVGALGIAGAVLLARRSHAGEAIAVGLFVFPLAYYVTHFMERYRFPIEPLILLCGCALVLSLVDRVRPSRAPLGSTE